MLCLCWDDGIGKFEVVEVIIVNSYDGISVYQMFVGMLCFVCINSMIVGEWFEEVCVLYKGNIEYDIIEGVFIVVEDFFWLIDVSELMKMILFLLDEQCLFGEVSFVVCYGDDESLVWFEQIIELCCCEDVDCSLWIMFNVIQENVVCGGLQGCKCNVEGCICCVQICVINGIDQNVMFNCVFWMLVEGMQCFKVV